MVQNLNAFDQNKCITAFLLRGIKTNAFGQWYIFEIGSLLFDGSSFYLDEVFIRTLPTRRFSLERNQFFLLEYPDEYFVYLNGYLDGIFNIWTVLNLKSHLFTNFHNSIVCTAQINFGGKNVQTVLIDINKQISTRATIKFSSNYFYRLFRSIYLFWWWFWLLFLSINGVQMKFFPFFHSKVDLKNAKGWSKLLDVHVQHQTMIWFSRKFIYSIHVFYSNNHEIALIALYANKVAE